MYDFFQFFTPIRFIVFLIALFACEMLVFYFFSLSAGMKKVFMMLVVVEVVNWVTHWSLFGQIYFTLFGLAIFFWMKRNEKPKKEIIEPFFHNEGIWSDITNYKN